MATLQIYVCFFVYVSAANIQHWCTKCLVYTMRRSYGILKIRTDFISALPH